MLYANVAKCALSRLIFEQCQFEITLTAGDDFLPVRWMNIVNQHCKCLAQPSIKNHAITQDRCGGINKPINHPVNTTFNISYKQQLSKTTRILITSSTYLKLVYIQKQNFKRIQLTDSRHCVSAGLIGIYQSSDVVIGHLFHMQ